MVLLSVSVVETIYHGRFEDDVTYVNFDTVDEEERRKCRFITPERTFLIVNIRCASWGTCSQGVSSPR